MHKILLVEDNEINRDMLSRRLARKGYEVAIATDGAEAVAKAQSERPDLVLMDLHLPILDGWQATQQIKANPQTQTIPVIALTADVMTGEREKAIAAGCDDYDTKPVDLPQLVAKITRLLTLTAPMSAITGQSGSAQQTPFQLHLQRLLRTRLRHQDFDPPLYSLIGYSDLLLDALDQPEYIDLPETLRNDIQKIRSSSEQLQRLIHAVLNPALVEVQQQEANLFAPILRREMLTPMSTIVGYCEILLEESPANFKPDLDRIYMSAQNLLSKVNGLDSLVEQHIEFIQASDVGKLSESQAAAAQPHLQQNLQQKSKQNLQQDAQEDNSIVSVKDSRILVIDSDAYNYALLSRHLESQGFQVTVAETSRLALEAIAIMPYDLILSEITLSEANGLALLTQIKQHQNSQHTPILVIAAPDEREVIARSIAMGATDYITRPYQSVMLKTKVTQHIEYNQLKRQNAMLAEQVAALHAELTYANQQQANQQAVKVKQTDPSQSFSQSFQPLKTAVPLAEKSNLQQTALPIKVLLVEDNELNSDMLSRRLKRAGYEVAVASDGAEGVERALTEQPQVILMDISLPVMDGWEATQQLKADAQTAQIPVIALTAHAMAGDRDKAIAAGCDDYDTKPIDLPRLLDKIEDCLERSATR